MKTAFNAPLQILKLRLLVGFLGEKSQFNWRDCGFLAPLGQRFLQTTFPRTSLDAALRFTTQASSPSPMDSKTSAQSKPGEKAKTGKKKKE